MHFGTRIWQFADLTFTTHTTPPIQLLGGFTPSFGRHDADWPIKGDLVECGVFKGDMAWVVSTLLADDLHGRTYYLYDSFEGFSSELSRAEDYPENPGFFDFANKVYREPGLYEAVTRRFAENPNMRVIRGFLPGSLSVAMPDQIAFLHVDLNAPAAEVKVLEVLFDRVVTGGIIVFDDYGWQVFHRQREAEDLFMASRGHRILELPTGQGMVMTIDDYPPAKAGGGQSAGSKSNFPRSMTCFLAYASLFIGRPQEIRLRHFLLHFLRDPQCIFTMLPNPASGGAVGAVRVLIVRA